MKWQKMHRGKDTGISTEAKAEGLMVTGINEVS